MKSKQARLINVIIFLGLAAVVTLTGVIIFLPKTEPVATPPLTPLQDQTVQDISFKSTLSKDDLEHLTDFLHEAIQEQFWPSELTMNFFQKGNTRQGDAYIGSWNKDGRFISVLYGYAPGNKEPMYLRAWIMPAGDKVTSDEAVKFLGDVFTMDFVPESESLTCKTTTNPDDVKDTLTECATLKTMPDGSLHGMTVRAPVTLAPPPEAKTPGPKVIIAATCLVPEDRAALYPAPSCI